MTLCPGCKRESGTPESVAATEPQFPMTLARRVRRARFNVLYWLLAHTQTGRAVLWHEWFKGAEHGRTQERWRLHA